MICRTNPSPNTFVLYSLIASTVIVFEECYWFMSISNGCFTFRFDCESATGKSNEESFTYHK